MNRMRWMIGAFFALLLVPAVGAFAQTSATPAAGFNTLAQVAPLVSEKGLAIAGGAIGAGLVMIGAGKGIGMIGAHATDAIARQPEAGGRIFTTMIISAALIEGATLFALVICLIRA